MGTAAFGSGILKGLDVPGAIDLFTGFLDHLGDYDQSVASLPESEQLEALLMLAAGDGVVFDWDPAREQISIEAENTEACVGIARALSLLATCLAGPAVITMLDEAGRSWRNVLANDDVSLGPASMHVDGPMLTLSLLALAWRSGCSQPIAQAADGAWQGASRGRNRTMAVDDEIDGEALFEELEAEVDAMLAEEEGESPVEPAAAPATEKPLRLVMPVRKGPATKKAR